MEFLNASIYILFLGISPLLRELRHKLLRNICRRYLDIHAEEVVTGNDSVQNQIHVSEESLSGMFHSIAQSSAPQKRVEYKMTRKDKKFSLLSREIYHRRRCADKDGEEDNPAWSEK